MLAAGRHWQNKGEIQLLQNANREITGVFTEPAHMVGLLEMAIIHFGKSKGNGPTINVAFDESRPETIVLPSD